MDRKPVVVLLSDSVVMEGLGDSLRDELGLNVIQMNNHTSGLSERVSALAPDLIVIDLDTQQLACILSLLRMQPDTLLLGIDQRLSQVTVLNCHRFQICSIQEFCQLAQATLNRSEYTQKGDAKLNHYACLSS